MKKLLLCIVLFLVACQTAPATPPLSEAPAKVTEQPAPTENPPIPPPEPAPTETSADCKTSCLDSCNANLDKVCGQGTDYYGCLENCNGYLRVEGCKAVCSTESYPECSAVFKSECKQECNKKCPVVV